LSSPQFLGGPLLRRTTGLLFLRYRTIRFTGLDPVRVPL
jgi:hypothetical protein